MPFSFENLDRDVRGFMQEELQRDLDAGVLYLSSRLRDGARDAYAAALCNAFGGGDEVSLAAEIRTRALLREQEQRRKPTGGFTMAKVPKTAPETLAEGEFNRFYVRAVCRKAKSLGVSDVIVYRAKPVEVPRPESQAMIGRAINADRLLNDLRASPGVEPALGLPPGPNSGLSVRLP